MWLVGCCLTSLLRWVDYIKTMLVRCCLTVLLGTFFFFSNDITGGFYTFKPCGLWNIVWQFCSERFFSFLIISQMGYIDSNLRLVRHCLTVLLGTFFSFLIILQVGCIHSIHAISETLSDSSAWNVFFFFSNNITGGFYTFKPCGLWNIAQW